MSWSYDPSGWSSGTKPSLTDFQNIAYDLHTLGGNLDAARRGHANAAFATLVPQDLPGTAYTVTAGSWTSGTATLTIGSHNIKVGQWIVISGVTPSGYNNGGVEVAVTGVTGTQVSYALTSNPGAWTSGGTVTIWGTPAAGMLATNPSGSLHQYSGSAWGAVAGGLADPGSNGLVKRTALNTTIAATPGTDFVAPINAPAAWAAATLQNGWASAGGSGAPAAYMLDALGFVHIRGYIQGGTTTDGTVLFILPVGFRPPLDVEFAWVASSSNTFCRGFIQASTGAVLLYAAVGVSMVSIFANFSTQ